MFFILSKLLINLIYPITWIGIAILAALLFKSPHTKKRCLIAALCIFILFSNPFLLNLFAKLWDVRSKEPTSNYSCAIVLGGFVNEDKSGDGYFNTSSDRFLQAIKLKTSGKVNNLLFSGGNADVMPSGFKEADWIKKEIRNYGISDSCILIERESRNTLENARFSKALLMSRKLPPPYLLVTSAFHMRRSIQTFKNLGTDVIPYSCNYIAGREKATLSSFIPRAGVLSTWNFYIKEVIGFAVYYFKS